MGGQIKEEDSMISNNHEEDWFRWRFVGEDGEKYKEERGESRKEGESGGEVGAVVADEYEMRSQTPRDLPEDDDRLLVRRGRSVGSNKDDLLLN